MLLEQVQADWHEFMTKLPYVAARDSTKLFDC